MMWLPGLVAALALLCNMVECESERSLDPLQQYPPFMVSRLPDIACPYMFSYRFNSSSNTPFGLLTVPIYQKPTVYELEVNMSVNAQVNPEDGLEILVLSTQDDVLAGKPIVYAITFPHVAQVPKLVQVKFNGGILCRGASDPIGMAETQTIMWAKSTMLTNQPAPPRRPENYCPPGAYCPPAGPGNYCPPGAYCPPPSSVEYCPPGAYCPPPLSPDYCPPGGSAGYCPPGDYCPLSGGGNYYSPDSPKGYPLQGAPVHQLQYGRQEEDTNNRNSLPNKDNVET